MKKNFTLVLLLFALSQSVYAEMVVIEADDFPAETDLNPVFPRISFIWDAYTTLSTHCSNGQLGTNVIGRTAWDDWWCCTSDSLYIDIDDGYAKSVSFRVIESTEDFENCYDLGPIVWLRLSGKQGYVVEEDYAIVSGPDPDQQYTTLSITRQDYDITRAEIDVTRDTVCLDHIEILLNPKQILTIKTDPNSIDTTLPTPGEHIYHLDSTVKLSTDPSPLCPNIYQLDHWVGDVTDANSANTTILMESDKTVTAVFTPTRECGDECHPDDLFGDYNHDCIIDLEDYAQFANNWLICTKPECD